MDLQNNRIMLAVIGILTLSLAIIMSVKLTGPSRIKAKPIAIGKVPEPEEGIIKSPQGQLTHFPRPSNMRKVEANANVLFTLKTACRDNVKTINQAVEAWNMVNSEWPKDDLSDIGRDRDYFPNGIPTCPVDGSAYYLDPVLHRVAGHGHGDIVEPGILNQIKKEHSIEMQEQKGWERKFRRKTGKNQK